ncbi:ABC transporter ATP-binding protein [Paenibacillus sp. IB182496]|uniref:ABC transporter ATP-binding protein n=1 Tax=Paenibacillus sabuli TaxID=2772509 RepID=A0A927BW96_9BACL|nr:ABC transporter ATP-binding protein [Paenibacillus sabuli]MBD2848038.1 ABC transporter ATP-binding protein [Paenibacillus sabuli]
MEAIKIQNQANWKEKLRIYGWIVSFVGKYKGPFAALLMAGLIQSGVLLTIPKFIQQVIDVIVPTGNLAQLWTMLAMLVPLIALMLVAMAVRNRMQRILQEKGASDLQLAVFRQLRRLGFAYYETHPTGETLSLFQAEVPAIQQIYRRYLPVLIERSILLLVSLALLIALNPLLTLLIVPFFLSYYLIGPQFERRQAAYAQEGTRTRANYNQKLYDSLTGLLELRIHRAERWDLGLLLDKFEVNRGWWQRELLYALLRGTARRMTVNLGALALFVFGAWAVRSGSMDVGAFVAFLLYYFTVMQTLTTVVTMATEQSMLVMQGEKLYRLMQEEPALQEPARGRTLRDVAGRLELDNVSFAYAQLPDRPVLRGVTLTVAPGERVAFAGASGGGKSTLLKLIGRFYDPSDGALRLDGIPLQELESGALRQALGYVFQETYLFGDSVLANIRFGRPQASDEEVRAAARAANADAFIAQLPQGYDTPVGERGYKLSGGQRQRIAIARMILKNPAVVLLDEATSALDNRSEREVQEALDRLLAGRTTIAVAHRLSTVRHYDRIVVLEDGRIAEQGGYDALMARRGALYRLVMGEEAIAHA